MKNPAPQNSRNYYINSYATILLTSQCSHSNVCKSELMTPANGKFSFVRINGLTITNIINIKFNKEVIKIGFYFVRGNIW